MRIEECPGGFPALLYGSTYQGILAGDMAAVARLLLLRQLSLVATVLLGTTPPAESMEITRSSVELVQPVSTGRATAQPLYPGGGAVESVSDRAIAVSVAVTVASAQSAELFASVLQVVCLLDGGLESIPDAPCVQTDPGSDQVGCRCVFDQGSGGVHSVAAFAVVRGDPSARLLGRPLYVRTPPAPPASVPRDQHTPKRAAARGVPGPRRLPVGVYFSTIFGNGAAVWQNMTETLGHNPLTVESALTSGAKFQVRKQDPVAKRLL